MLKECCYCDKDYNKYERQLKKDMTKLGEKYKPHLVKTIDTKDDDYVIVDNKKYYHIECYKEKLKKEKRLDGEIEKNINQLILEIKAKKKNIQEKNILIGWLKNFYNTTSISSFYFKKIQALRDGKNELVDEEIDFQTLLDMYIFYKDKLNNNAAKKHFDSIPNHMIYDLQIIVNKIGDYKQKNQNNNLQFDNKKLEETIKEDKLINNIQIQKTNKEDQFNIINIMDDLLL